MALNGTAPKLFLSFRMYKKEGGNAQLVGVINSFYDEVCLFLKGCFA